MQTQIRHISAGLVAILVLASFGITTLRAQDGGPGNAGSVVEQVPTRELETLPPAPVEPTPQTRIVETFSNPIDDGAQMRSIASANALLSVDASVTPSEVRAGELLTYTYQYTNTSGGPLTNVFLRVLWSNMRNTNVIADISQTQFCLGSCEPLNVSGTTPTYGDADTVGNNIKYTIGNLAAGTAGNFSVVLRLRSNVYPRSGISPVRPASSVLIFANGGIPPVADDTISSLVVGPAFKVSKATAVGSPTQITLGEHVDFVINVGNATAPGDTIDGQPRADARPATNVTIIDRFPDGAEYVPTSDPPGIARSASAASGLVTWTIPSLAVGEPVSVTVRYRKPTSQSNLAGCSTLNNQVYSAGANEYPFESTNVRYRIAGDQAAINVVPVVQIAAITFVPNTAYYGETVSATIRVLNHYTQAVNGARMIVSLPASVRYVPNSASPTVNPSNGANIFFPPGSINPPQTLTWTLNLPAGSATAPTMLSYTLQLRAEQLEMTSLVEARVQVPSGVPAGCLTPKGEYIRTAPRLVVATSRFPNSLPSLISTARPYTFSLEVTNNGTVTATNATVTASLPFDSIFPAAFSYIPGTASMNGNPLEPDLHVAGNGGFMRWNNITLPPKSLTRFVFSVMPDGFEYVEYCIGGSAITPVDPIASAPIFALYNCVKVNPPLDISKTADRLYLTNMATPASREITYTLMITNTGIRTYHMGLRDFPDTSLEYIRQVSSNNGVPTAVTVQPNNALELHWPLQDVAPGERLEAVIVMRIPAGGTRLTFRNELGFRFRESNNTVVRVSQVPPVEAYVSQRGTLFYNVSTANTVYGPGDKVKYVLSAYNNSPAQPMSSIVVTDILPAGFTFDSMAPDSDVADQPTFVPGPSGRVALRWNLSYVPPQQSRRITFFARAASFIGSFENWLTMASNEPFDTACQPVGLSANCATYTANSSPIPIAIVATSIEALATLEPSLLDPFGDPDSSCVLPGDERTYKLALVNTNSHAYGNTTVRIRLPYGVTVVNNYTSGSSGIVTLPSFTTEPDGSTLVLWSDINLPAKPFNAASAQILLYLDLRIGRFAGNVPIVSTASSPDGDILRKDDALDPALRLCLLTAPMLFKETNKIVANPDDIVVFQLSAINPANAIATISLRDVLAGVFTYSSTLVGPAPQVAGNTLTWSNVAVPAASGGVPGITVIRFAVRVAANPTGGLYANVGEVTASSAVFDTSLATAEIEVNGIVIQTPTPTPRPIVSPTPRPTSTVTNTPPPGSTPTNTPPPGSTPTRAITSPTPRSSPTPVATLRPGQATYTPVPTPLVGPTLDPSLDKRILLPVVRK